MDKNQASKRDTTQQINEDLGLNYMVHSVKCDLDDPASG
jgi:hypothetical protein